MPGLFNFFTVVKATASSFQKIFSSRSAGDIFMLQKDYFNAKATFESVAKNAAIPELKKEAEQKFDAAVAAEKKQSKIAD